MSVELTLHKPLLLCYADAAANAAARTARAQRQAAEAATATNQASGYHREMEDDKFNVKPVPLRQVNHQCCLHVPGLISCLSD
jgi:hypothetical protein